MNCRRDRQPTVSTSHMTAPERLEQRIVPATILAATGDDYRILVDDSNRFAVLELSE